MSFLDIIFGPRRNPYDGTDSQNRDNNNYAFIDIEVTNDGKKIADTGALRHDGAVFHKASRKDVVLDFFRECKNDVLALRGGDALTLRGNYLCVPASGRAVAKLSKAKQEKNASWAAKGYHATTASVRFIVAWKPKDAAKHAQSTAVLLAEITLCRQ